MGFRNPINGVPPSSIDGDLIAPDSIGTEHLVADAITAKHTITGALIRTAASGQRWEMDSTPANEIRAYSDDPDETAHGNLAVGHNGTDGYVDLYPPSINGASVPSLRLRTDDFAGLDADIVSLGHLFGTLQPYTPLRVDGEEVTFGPGRGIKEVQFGKTSVNPNGNGEATIIHGLDGTPVIVLTKLVVGNFNGVNANNYTSREFDVTIYTAGGNPVSSGRTVAWLAIR